MLASSSGAGLLVPRQTYKPFIYDAAAEFWAMQQQAHWLHTEVTMGADVQDWKLNLTDAERSVVGGVLKGFIQTEIIVNDYWSQVARWFKHPEIAMMATTFAAAETVHMAAYAHLNDSLGLTDYDAFLSEPTAKAKIDRVISLLADEKASRHDIALSLAAFSAFTEGVSLFASFAVLLNFSRFNKLKGVGQIVSWSIRDESLHSKAGCWLFREFIHENQDLWTPELKKEIIESARHTVALEDEFIDQVFSVGEVEGLTAHDLKAFVRHRANAKLHELGLGDNWRRMDKDAVERMSWFNFMSSGVEHQDFFAQRVVDYSKGAMDFDAMWEGVKLDATNTEIN